MTKQEILQLYRRSLNISFKIIKNKEQSEEIAQEVIIKILEQLKNNKLKQGAVSGKIIKYRVIDSIRKYYGDTRVNSFKHRVSERFAVRICSSTNDDSHNEGCVKEEHLSSGESFRDSENTDRDKMISILNFVSIGNKIAIASGLSFYELMLYHGISKSKLLHSLRKQKKNARILLNHARLKKKVVLTPYEVDWINL